MAVIVTLPAPTAETTPYSFTLATDVLLELQVTDLSVALEGVTLAVRVLVLPATSDKVEGLTDTPVTGMTVETGSCDTDIV